MSFLTSGFRPFARSGWGGRAAGHFRGMVRGPAGTRGQIGTRSFRAPAAAVNDVLSGVSRDSTGAPLAGCTVNLFRTVDNSFVDSTVSDGSGAWSIPTMARGPFFLVEYLAGSPDRFGTSPNTLVAA